MTRAKRTLRRATIVAAVVGVVLLARNPILVGVARFMTVETAIVHADAVLPLYQDGLTIPPAAAAWLQRGYAPKVLVYRRNLSRVERLGLRPAPHVAMRRLLETHGVASDRIVEIGHDIKSWKGLVEAIVESLGRGSVKRVIVIASAPQSRLTWMALGDAMKDTPVDFRLDAVAPTAFNERNWWHTRDGVITYFDSYVLWLLRSIR